MSRLIRGQGWRRSMFGDYLHSIWCADSNSLFREIFRLSKAVSVQQKQKKGKWTGSWEAEWVRKHTANVQGGGVLQALLHGGARDQGELCNPSRSERSQSANTKKDRLHPLCVCT